MKYRLLLTIQRNFKHKKGEMIGLYAVVWAQSVGFRSQFNFVLALYFCTCFESVYATNKSTTKVKQDINTIELDNQELIVIKEGISTSLELATRTSRWVSSPRDVKYNHSPTCKLDNKHFMSNFSDIQNKERRELGEKGEEEELVQPKQPVTTWDKVVDRKLFAMRLVRMP